MAIPPLTNDSVVEDATERRTKIQLNTIDSLMDWDESICKADELLANQHGFIRDGRRFVKAFRTLVGKGCGVQALSQSLCYFRRYLSARSTPAGRKQARFPSRSRIRKLVSMLREASEEVSYLEWNYVPSQAVTDRERFRRERATARAAAESSSIFQALSPRAKERSRRMSEREDYWYSNDYKFLDMTHNMDDYALILELWEPPRADSIRTYGLIAPAVFCEIATGKPRYELVTELLSSCSRKEFDLRKRATYFQKQFSEPYRVLRSRLEMIHENGGLPGYVPHVDFEELLTKLEKSST